MDSLLGVYKQLFARGQPFTYDTLELAEFYRCYIQMMTHWHEVLPGRIFTIEYEALVADTETMTRGLLEHCGIPFEEACLRFFENKRPVRTASSEQVRQPIYNKAVQFWKNFETELEPLSKALGAATLSRFAGS